jgi:hypothetical protein
LSIRALASFLVAWSAFAAPALAQQSAAPVAPVPPAKFQVTRATSTIKIDGVLDEDAWKQAAMVPLPFEWAPGDNTPPPVSTECLVTFDATALYLACRAADPDPSAIRAHLMDRDAIDTFIQDDHIGFMIDTFNDKRRAFQFRSTAGVQADAVFSEQDGVEDFSWDMMWNAVASWATATSSRWPSAEAASVQGGRRGADGLRSVRPAPQRAPPNLVAAPRPNVRPPPGEQDRGLRPAQAQRRVDPTATFSRTDELASPGRQRADQRRSRR